MIVRAETPADWPLIRAVQEAAFPGPGEAALIDQLRVDGALRLSLVAVEGDEVIGHAAFSQMQAPFRALGLGPVGVRPDRQGTGAGTQLVKAGLEQAEAQGWQGAFVLGDPRYYGRFGFQVGQAAGFQCRYAGPHFMAMALGSETLPVSTGDLAYPAAFDALD
ncbi:MAG TPA: N-acetyltransferase [Caulobacteraceae bacterium]|jgi:putative acetyltransferase